MSAEHTLWKYEKVIDHNVHPHRMRWVIYDPNNNYGELVLCMFGYNKALEKVEEWVLRGFEEVLAKIEEEQKC